MTTTKAHTALTAIYSDITGPVTMCRGEIVMTLASEDGAYLICASCGKQVAS